MRGMQDFKIALLGGPDFATRMTCAEAGCGNYARGFAVVLDPEDEKHAGNARYIEWDSGRQYVKQRSEEALDYFVNHGEEHGLVIHEELMVLLQRTPPGMLVYVFPPGQQCFKRHQDREVVFTHDRYVHTRPLDYNEDWNGEAHLINRAKQRG